jgi:hypothetical protein
MSVPIAIKGARLRSLRELVNSKGGFDRLDYNMA